MWHRSVYQRSFTKSQVALRHLWKKCTQSSVKYTPGLITGMHLGIAFCEANLEVSSTLPERLLLNRSPYQAFAGFRH
jgi:hypothetical protein